MHKNLTNVVGLALVTIGIVIPKAPMFLGPAPVVHNTQLALRRCYCNHIRIPEHHEHVAADRKAFGYGIKGKGARAAIQRRAHDNQIFNDSSMGETRSTIPHMDSAIAVLTPVIDTEVKLNPILRPWRGASVLKEPVSRSVIVV